MIFEIHITGDSRIHDACRKLYNLKTIEIVSLEPDGSILEKLHMTSLQWVCNSYEECLESTLRLERQLKEEFSIDISRVKIEAPPYSELYNSSLYMEAHFKDNSYTYPSSVNMKSKNASVLGTDRTYDKASYESFKNKWAGKEVEVCLYDTNVTQDDVWMNLYRGAQ